MKTPDIILASSSPRRQELLRLTGFTFRIVVPEIDETPNDGETPVAYAERAAVDKARAVAESLEHVPGETADQLVIAGDTIVALGDRILGKPAGADEAKTMLRELSDCSHQVISGLCAVLVREGMIVKECSAAVTTDVDFKKLSDAEIEAYVSGGEPMDKAGAYAIQGGAGYMVRRIRGSHSNVIGLPLCELVEMLENDFDLPAPGAS
jgi:septum formation protein